MRKIVFALGVFLIGIISYSTVYAGTINSYEQEVISYAQGTFTYNGVSYKVDSYYLSVLRDYLMDDNVDLTAAQRDKVFQLASGYIETGVLGGYLVPVSGQAGPIAPGTDSNNNGNTGNHGNSGGIANPEEIDKTSDTGIAGGTNIATTGQLGATDGVGNTSKDEAVYTDDTDNTSIPVGQDNSLVNNENTTSSEALPKGDSSNDAVSTVPKKSDEASTDKISVNASKTSNTNKSNSNNKVNESSAQANKGNSATSKNTTGEDGEISESNSITTESFLKELLDMVLGIEVEAAVVTSEDDNANKEPVVKQVSRPVKDTTITNNTVTMNAPITRTTDSTLHTTYLVSFILGFLMLSGIIVTMRLKYMAKKS